MLTEQTTREPLRCPCCGEIVDFTDDASVAIFPGHVGGHTGSFDHYYHDCGTLVAIDLWGDLRLMNQPDDLAHEVREGGADLEKIAAA